LLNVGYNTVMHFINTVFIFLIIRNVTKKVYSRKDKWIFIITSTILISILYNTVYKKISFITISTLISLVLYVILSYFILKNRIYHSIIGISIFYILGGIGEAISYLIFVYKMELSSQYIKSNLGINTILHAINYLIFSLYLALSLFNRKLIKKNTFTNYQRQAMTAIIITLIIIAFATYYWFYNGLNVRTLVMVNVMLTLVFLIANTTYILTLQKALKENKENEELKTYIRVTQELSEELRRFKHNYRNLLYGLGGYIENKDWDSLRAYYNDLLEASSEINSSDIYSIRNIKNNFLFGLLSQKIGYIKELDKKISIQIHVPEEIGKFPIRECDICEVVGAYMDNAIEAASQATDKQIIFEMFKNDGNLHIIIKNTFANAPDLSRIFDMGYTTKKEQGKGLGLYFAKNILNKYDNILYNTYIKGEYFVQEIILQDN